MDEILKGCILQTNAKNELENLKEGHKMRTLEFDVDRQRLTKKDGCDFSSIVAGTIGYLRAKFYFSKDEWDGCRKAASFWVDDQEYAVLLDDNDSCIIPKEVTDVERFSVSVTGARLNYKITTTKIKITQEVC